MKKKKTDTVVTTMKAASAILNLPMWIIQEAKNAGCLAFKNSGRVNVDELSAWIKNDWEPMPSSVFEHFRAEWVENQFPRLLKPLGIADSIEEASKRTGLSVSMIKYIRDAGCNAFMG